MKMFFRRAGTSFLISAFVGLVVNLLIDVIGNGLGTPGFVSISPDFLAKFPTPVMATYVNVLLYGVIGATFGGATVLFECRRIGVIVQWCLYFVITSAVCLFITIYLWQLQKYPQAIICTLAGYAVTYAIIGVVQYRKLKEDIKAINESIRG